MVISPPPVQPTPPEHRLPNWGWKTVVVAVGITLLAVVWRPEIFMVDDAWFYLQIGRNIALGLGSTFDGETPTNGYHPLWQGVVALLGALTTDRASLFRLALGVQVTAVIGALLAHARAYRDAGVPFPTIVVVMLLLTQYSDKGWMSEGPLTALFLGLSLLLTGVPAGLAAGLLMLARLDTVFFVAAGVLLRRDRVRFGGAAALIVVPWAAWQVYTWGHLVPVSGAIKSTFPWPDLTSPVAKIGWIGILTGLGSAVSLGFAAVRPQRRALLGSLGIGGLVHVLYTLLFTGPQWSAYVPYYWVVASAASAAAIGEGLVVYLGYLPSLSTDARRSLVAGLSVFIALGASGRAVRSLAAEPDPTIALGHWIARELPDSRLLALDAPGRVAWYSGRPVFAVDGLTRSYTFSDDVLGGMDPWARAHRVTHLVAYDVPMRVPWTRVDIRDPQVEVRFFAPKTGVEVGGFVLDRGAALVRLTDLVPATENAAAVYAWPQNEP